MADRFFAWAGLLVLLLAAAANAEADTSAVHRQRLKDRDALAAKAIELLKAGRVDDALEREEQVLAIEREVLPPDSEQLAGTLASMAKLHVIRKDFDTARGLYREAIEATAKRQGPEHYRVKELRVELAGIDQIEKLTPEQLRRLAEAELLVDRAMSLFNKRDYAAALDVAQKALQINKTLLGEEHPKTMISLGQIASIDWGQQKYDEAVAAEQRVLTLREKLFGVDHPDTAAWLKSLAGHYKALKNYEQAARNYERLLALEVVSPGSDSPPAAKTRGELASLYQTLGKPEAAVELYQQAIAAAEKSKGPDSAAAGKAVLDLANHYRFLHHYAEAAPYYEKAIAIYEKAIGPDHPGTAGALDLAGLNLKQEGNYAAALPLYRRALAIEEKTLGDHSSTATTLNNLAFLYAAQKNYAEAIALHRRALAMREKVLGPMHLLTAASLENLAAIYELQKDFAEALPLHARALNIYEKFPGPMNSQIASSRSHLIGLYESQGDYAAALPLVERTSTLQKAVLGPNHPSYAMQLSHLAFLHAATGDFPQAGSLVRAAIAITRDWLLSPAAMQSERSRLAALQAWRWQLDEFVSLAIDAGHDADGVFNEVLAWKGASALHDRAMSMAASNPTLGQMLGKWQQATGKIAAITRSKQEQWQVPPALATAASNAGAQAVGRQPDTSGQQLRELTAEKEKLATELAAACPALGHLIQKPSLDKLLAALPEDAVLVDYLEFTRHAPAKGRGASRERQFVAFVVRNASKPEDRLAMIPLGPAAPIEKAIEEWTNGLRASSDAAGPGKQLRAAIWEPVVRAIAGAKTVLVSADGVLGRLPLAALPATESGKYLLEERRLAMVPVPQLISGLSGKSSQREPAHRLLLVGDVDYDALPGSASAEAKKRQPIEPGKLLHTPSDGILFQPIAGSADELAAIEKLFADESEKRSGDRVRLTKQQATVERFCKLAPDSRIVHLATHAFFGRGEFWSADSAIAASKAAEAPVALPQAAPPAPPLSVVGIGAALEVKEGKLVVARVVPGGAAAADGRLKPGDVIQRMAEATGPWAELSGKSLEDNVKRIRGTAGSKIRLEVVTKDAKEPVVYELVRKAVTVPTAAPTEPSPLPLFGTSPGLLSGIALAGANLEPAPGVPEGILKSRQIVTLDLAAVELVVLSDCDQQAGQTAGGEGLLGLQRTLQVAGARAAVASYWQVEPDVKQVLLERFYRNLNEKHLSRLDALREAQLDLLDHPGELPEAARPNGDARTSPRVWAAFTLSGDWR